MYRTCEGVLEPSSGTLRRRSGCPGVVIVRLDNLLVGNIAKVLDLRILVVDNVAHAVRHGGWVGEGGGANDGTRITHGLAIYRA